MGGIDQRTKSEMPNLGAFKILLGQFIRLKRKQNIQMVRKSLI
jgi:hypothetical protein